MKRSKLRSLIFCFVVITLLTFPLSGNQKPDFPALQDLKDRNVSLEMKGFMFASGLRLNKQGKPNGHGDELVPIKWSGSGFIVKNDGTILTNYHVAVRALEGTAEFADGGSFQIKHIKVYDPINDIAVMKIRATKSFPSVKLGNSDRVDIMDKVLAVGNTLGEGFSVSDGMINQIKVSDRDVRYLIRHDAAIAPGNSGGALYRGDEVVGINVRGRVPYVVYYAIPINLAKALLKPQYDRKLLLADIFPTKLDLMIKKSKQLYTKTGQVPAASTQGAGKVYFQDKFYPLEDLIIILKAQKGRDLALTVQNSQGKLIGFGDLRKVDYDVILLSSDNYQAVYISVLNYDKTPANFAIGVYKILW